MAAGNEIGLHSYTHPEDTNVLTPTRSPMSSGRARRAGKADERLSGPPGVAGRRGGARRARDDRDDPGNPEIRHLSVGWLYGVGAGYPNAFGYQTPGNAADGKVYLAPNTMFDFSLIEFQKKTVAEAEAEWPRNWRR